MPRISFIIPTFNRADYIVESIESIICQMDPSDELLIVDDGSTDHTAAAIAPFRGRLNYIRQENAGKSTALNLGLSRTSGDYVWICDDDDLLLPGSVRRMVSALDASRADLVFGRYRRFYLENGHRFEFEAGYWPDLSNGSLTRHILEDSFVMHNATLVKREIYSRLGPFDPRMLRSQDYEMFVRLALSSSIKYVDDYIFLQRKHSGPRGPRMMLHDAGHSQNVWKEFDRRIFDRLNDLVPLSFFISMFKSSNQALAERAGFLQRACVLARHGLWNEALRDCVKAADLASDYALSSVEAAICRRMTSGKHGFAGILSQESVLMISQLQTRSRLGRAIVGQISRGLVWRLRSRDAVERKNAVRHFFKPSNFLALVAQLIRSQSVLSTELLCEQTPDFSLSADALDTWKKDIIL